MHAADPVHDARDWVVAGISAERALSGSVKAACAAAARVFGITPRRAASYWWDQVTFLGADEYLRIREGHHRRLKIQRQRAEAEMALCDALLAKIEALHAHEICSDQAPLHARSAAVPCLEAEAAPSLR